MSQKRKGRVDKRKVNKVSKTADIEVEDSDDTIALMKTMRTEMTEMRGFYANAVAETQAIQLVSQQASISDLLNRSPAKVMTPARNSASDTPGLRHAAIFLDNWNAVNSNLKVNFSA